MNLRQLKKAIAELESADLGDAVKRECLKYLRERARIAAIDNRIVFGLDGDQFRIEGELFKPSKGLEYISRIVHSKRTLELMELKEYSVQTDIEGITSPHEFRQTKESLRRVEKALAKPPADYSIDHLTELEKDRKRYQAQIDAVKYQMNKYAAGDTEARRNADSVTKAIRRTIEDIGKRPALDYIAEDFRQNITTGSTFRYGGKLLWKKP